MTLHSVATFERYVTSLPAVTVTRQWESHVAKIGGKVFALLGDDTQGIVFKVSEMSFEGLTLLEGIEQAPYFAKRQWVRVSKGADLRDKELRAYVAASYRMIGAKLTRKLRAELGIEAAISG